jgi:hypothetical protein
MRYSFVFIILGFAWDNPTAHAHARWKSDSVVSPPRSLNDNLKSAPCGGTTKGSNPRKYRGGESINLEFEETVNHPGYFEIHLLGKDDKPVQGVPSPLLKIEDNQNTQVESGKPHQFKATLQLPAVDCAECALQLIQVMLDNPQAPSNYYSCSDISISNLKSGPAKPTGLKINKRNIQR